MNGKNRKNIYFISSFFNITTFSLIPLVVLVVPPLPGETFPKHSTSQILNENIKCRWLLNLKMLLDVITIYPARVSGSPSTYIHTGMLAVGCKRETKEKWKTHLIVKKRKFYYKNAIDGRVAVLVVVAVNKEDLRKKEKGSWRWFQKISLSFPLQWKPSQETVSSSQSFPSHSAPPLLLDDCQE